MLKVKRAVSILLCVVLLLGAAPLGGLAGLELPHFSSLFAPKAQAATLGVLKYVVADGAVAITGCDTSATGALEIPAEINGYPVTSIGNSAFYGCTGLTSITIPDSVTSIGSSAFYGCTGLTSITIPDSVTSVGQWAFYNCSALASVVIGNGVVSIENYTFEGCVGLLKLEIGNSVASIGVNAFKGCSAGLESIVVYGKNNVYHSSGNCLIETEDKRLILGCKNSVIPDDGSVICIESLAFYNCAGLTNINIPESIKYVIGSSAFRGCTGLTSISIPNASGIGGYAFYECTGLKSVKISNKVYVIDNNAFNGCTGLTDVYYDGSEEEWNTTGINGTVIFEGNDDLLNATIHFLDDEPSHEHTFDGGVIIKEPTCKETGMKKYSCTECDYFYTESVEKLAHTPVTVTMPASCTIDGTSYVICSECGEPLSGYTPIPATGHHYDDGVITKDPTCTEDGVRTFTCTCGDNYTEPVDKLGHAPGDWETVKEPDEYTAGNAVIKCIRCGIILEEKELPKLETIKDEGTGVALIYNGESYDNEIDIKVVEIFDGKAYSIVNTQTGSSVYSVYDVTMLMNGEEIQPNGKIKVKIPLPKDYDPAHTFVYHINTANNAPEKMLALYQSGYMVFETDHFSYYAIVDETPSKPINPTENAKLSVKASATVDYNANVTITATATGIPTGYILAIYDGNTKIAAGDNTKVSHNVGNMTASKTYSIKVIDANGNVQRDGGENDLTATCEVKVKTGFFDKIIAFFRSLFGLLPKVEIKP